MNFQEAERTRYTEPAENPLVFPAPGLNRLDRRLRSQPAAVIWLLALALVAAIAAGDYLTGHDMSLAVLYLGPIFVVAWALGLRTGMVMSVLCTAVWSVSLLVMQPSVVIRFVHVWDIGIQCVMFVLFGVLIAKLKTALGHADERFAAVLEGMDAAVYVRDAKSRGILYANERFRQMFPPGATAPDLPADERQGEFHDTSRDQWYQVHARSTRWVDGRPVRLLLATDITERKRNDAQFRQQQEKIEATARFVAMGEMASTLAHELNQPLAALVNYNMGCVRRLRSGNWSQPELLETIEKAAAQAERAANVLQRVRAFVARRAPHLVACDLNSIVRGLGPMLLAEAEQGSAELLLELAERIPPVRCDPLLLEQVVLNLVRNGLEAMHDTPPAGRRLTIRSRLENGLVVFDFIDRGRGIDPQLEARLFTPFFSTKPQGTGLGLHICRSIIEAHGGRIWATRNGDAGTTFHFTLDVLHEAAE